MTVREGEDPALPEVSPDEAWYDAEIAPALAALATRCNERGMSFVAVVEYQPGDLGATYYLTKDAGTEMHMLNLCGQTVPNVDAYVISLKRWAKQNNVSTDSSFVLRGFGGATTGKEPGNV